MLVLFETAAGFAIFKANDKKIEKCENILEELSDPGAASKLIELEKFVSFSDTKDALSNAISINEGKISKKLNKLLKKLYVKDLRKDTLAVADKNLGMKIHEKFSVACVYDSKVQQLMASIRTQLSSLLPVVPNADLTRKSLGLAHSLDRYKLKCSPDKVDTMIVQAISLLDDLDKEANNYVMRCKEMYGWHFPELSKIITDNLVYIKVVNKIGMRENVTTEDLTDLLSEDLIEEVKKALVISLGTEVTDEDIDQVRNLCAQVMEISESRAMLYEYLKQRMAAVAPNLTVLTGELLGARLIAHAGTLMNLAKHPSSTVQILGAEKALFRALKTRHATPKYGLIYHAGLVGQASNKTKGKMSRSLAAKCSLAIRIDALGEDVNDNEMGIQYRAKLEQRLKDLESGQLTRISGLKGRPSQGRYSAGKFETSGQYDAGEDMTFGKRKFKGEPMVAGNGVEEEDEHPAKKMRMEDLEVKKEEPMEVKEEVDEVVSPKKDKKKKKKKKAEEEAPEPVEEVEEITDSPQKKKKKKKRKSSVTETE